MPWTQSFLHCWFHTIDERTKTYSYISVVSTTKPWVSNILMLNEKHFKSLDPKFWYYKYYTFLFLNYKKALKVRGGKDRFRSFFLLLSQHEIVSYSVFLKCFVWSNFESLRSLWWFHHFLDRLLCHSSLTDLIIKNGCMCSTQLFFHKMFTPPFIQIYTWRWWLY